MDISHLAEDKIKRLPAAFFKNIVEMKPKDIAYVVVDAVMGDEFRAEVLQQLVDEWLTFECELKNAGSSTYAYEPLRGATMSEYDLIGRFMALVVKYKPVLGDATLFSNSTADSTAAIAQAFKDILGKAPIMLQAVGVLTDLEKRQVNRVVPKDSLYVVKCDEATLNSICRNIVEAAPSGHDVVLMSDMARYAAVARAFMFFDMYRLIRQKSDKPIKIAISEGIESEKRAAAFAARAGLPVEFITSEALSAEVVKQRVITANSTTGYVLSPRSASQWSALEREVESMAEIGAFVQRAHPAKAGSVLEPLINRVIQKPHKLIYNDMPHTRYRMVAPTVSAIKELLNI